MGWRRIGLPGRIADGVKSTTSAKAGRVRQMGKPFKVEFHDEKKDGILR